MSELPAKAPENENPLPVEIERKFLLNCSLPQELLDNIPHKSFIKQGFLSIDEEKVVRIRVSTDRRSFQEGFLTVKGRSNEGGMTRTEIETPINSREAETLLKTFCPNIIDKTRYIINCNGSVWELDQFHGVNEGLWVAEIELSSEDQKFSKPSWIGKEVTTDSRYTNAALSKHPYTAWTEEEKQQ